MKIGEYIRRYRQEHHMSIRDFSTASGLTPGYISMLENDKNPRTGAPITPTVKTYSKIANATGVSFDALLASVDDTIAIGDAGPKNNTPPNILPMPTTVKKPRLGTIACGTPILAEENIEDYDEVPDWVKCDFTLLCKGDSMINARIYDGDIVCIKRQEIVENGQIAAVLIDGDFDCEATLKRFYFSVGTVTLMAENPTFPPLVFTGEEVNRVHVIGLATHFICLAK